MFCPHLWVFHYQSDARVVRFNSQLSGDVLSIGESGSSLRRMGFMNRNEDKPLNHYASLSIRDQAMVKALSRAIGDEVRAALAEDREARQPQDR